MPQDTAAYDAALKTVYEGGIRELIPTKVRLYNKFKERDAKDWGGRYVEFPARVGRNQGSGFASERGQLPAAGAQQYATVRIPMRYQYGRMQLSAQVMKASQGSKAAFAPAMEQEMDGLIKDMTAEMGRAICYDGRGILALTNGDPGATSTVTVDSPGGVAGATNGARFINPGQRITFVNPGTGAVRASAVEDVVTVPAAGTTFTTGTTAVAAIADNDYIVKYHGAQADAGAIGNTSYNKESMGLLGLIDDGTYVATIHGVSRTTYPIFQSTVIGAVGAISADVIQRAIDLVDQRGDGEIDTLVMHHSVRRSYLASMDTERRYISGDLQRPDAGTVAAKKGTTRFGGIEIMEEKHAPYGVIVGGDTSTWTRYVEVAGEWVDEDGAILDRIGSGATLEDSFEAVYRVWQNFHCEKPSANFRLDGVTATVVVAHID